MNRTRTNKTIESFVVIILMVVVLASMVVLMNSGRVAYSRILSNSKSIQDARTALSYINMKIRQNDMEGSMEYSESILDGMDALVIRHSGAEEGMVTYIFHDGHALREVYVMEDRVPDPEDGILIVEIDGIDIGLEEDEGILRVTVYYDEGTDRKSMERVIGIRSWRE
ncbi:MAG TPA: DUF4860 domain-containing protein [Clostridia bacterium]|nr:DUF4860 domain-containing protein [Clostridia bacterium]HPQ46547.1 DUF4860 domain-containing protein [Clostridia bacterium]